MKQTTALTRTVTDAKVTRLRLTLGVRSLFQQKDNGDTVAASVDLVVTVGHQQYPVNFNGKYSSQYLRQMVIDNLPSAVSNQSGAINCRQRKTAVTECDDLVKLHRNYRYRICLSEHRTCRHYV